MIRLIVFDLDNTLAPVGKPVSGGDIALINEIRKKGIHIVVCSGKPVFYLCGFMRQAGLQDSIMIGENGGVIQFGIELPPSGYYKMTCSEDAKKTLSFLREAIIKEIPDIWFQPNEIMLTPFPSKAEEFDIIDDILNSNPEKLRDIEIYRHSDCFDFVPNGITKSSGLACLGKLLGIRPEEMLAVGDGPNDYTMFDYVGTSIGINLPDPARVTYNMNSITQALMFVQ